MKKLIASTLIAATLALTGCGEPRNITVDGKAKTYPTYGFFNESTEKSEHVCYEVSIGNIFWSIVLVETVIAPVYFVGFSLFNPIRAKGPSGCGIDA